MRTTRRPLSPNPWSGVEALERRTLMSGIPPAALKTAHGSLPGTRSVAAPTPAPTLAWFDTNWGYRQQITIDHTQVRGGTDLSDFPVLIDLGSDGGLAAHALTNGNDIVFTSSDGATKLAHEIDSFTASTGQLLAWVKVPTLSATADTVLYMYYGNSAAANQQDAAGVWDSTTAAVYHLGETADPYLDSTGNANNSTNAGTDPAQVAGQIGGAQLFDGSTTNVLIPDPATLDPALNATVSTWARIDATGQADIVEKGGNGGYTFWLDGNVMWFGSQYSSQPEWAVGTTPLSVGVWYEFDGVNNNGIKSVYVDGALDASSSTPNAFNNSGALQIGNGVDGRFSGAVDELRIENVARSAGWIGTKFSNQSSPGTFYAVGTQTSQNHAPAGTDGTIYTSENTPYVFNESDFGFTDPSDSIPNAFAAVKISTLPVDGALTFSGTPVTAGQSVAVADLDAGSLQFAPAAHANGADYASFAFQVIDDGSTSTGFDLDPTPKTITMNVAAVNDAPVLSGANPFSTITEDQIANAGDLVATLISGQVSDFDDSALSGVAVTDIDNGNGRWQFSTDGQSTWNDVATVAGSSALLLRSTDALRLVPDGQNGTAASVTFRAWDQTSGTAGSYADTSANGGTSAFSSASATAALDVTPIDDPPVVSSIDTLQLFRENTPVDLTDMVITDVDSTAVTATWTLSDPTAGALSTGTSGSATSTYRAGTGVWRAAGNIADVNALLARLTFTPARNYASDFTISVSVSDGTAAAVMGIKPMTAIPVDQASVAIADSYTVDQGDTLTVTDPSVLANDANIAGDSLTAIAVTSPSDGTLQLHADGSFVYTPSPDFNGVDTFTYKASDGRVASAPATVSIAVNPRLAPPVLANLETRDLRYSENQPAKLITSMLSVSADGAAPLTGAVVQITGNYQAGEDLLSLGDLRRITSTWDASTGTLTLTGTDSTAHYQAALRAVAFTHASPTPLGMTRTISFTVSRGTADSNTLTRNVIDVRPGLVPLQTTLDTYINRRADLTPNRLRVLSWARGKLVKYFGADRAVGTITVAEATQFKNRVQNLVPSAYTAKLMRLARRFFADAVDQKILYRSPFSRQSRR